MKKYILLGFLILSTLSVKAQKKITITYERNKDNSVDFYYKKELPGSYYINLKFTDLTNTFSGGLKKVIKSDNGHLLKLKPIKPEQGIGFGYTFNYIRGNPNPRIDKSFNYVLPFKEGKTMKILETTSLKEKYFGAEKDPNWKSFMVDCKYADTIYSMRKGIIIEIVNEFETDSLDAYKYTSKMNRVLIEHKDGTIATYVGFNKKLIFVRLGQTVYPQTQIGVLDIFNNSVYRLYFSVSYLKKINFDTFNKLNYKSKEVWSMLHLFFIVQ